ncbi:MAG TPA: DinB family protein [Vicinamibacterales bacterium]
MKSIITSAAIALAVGAVSISAQAPQPRPPQTLSAYLQGQYANIKTNLIRTAEKIPAEHFSFRPTPEVRTVAELFGHTMEAQYSYCSNVKGGVNPAAGKQFEKTVTDKAGVEQMVKDAFAYCDDAYASLTDAKAIELITIGVAPNQRQASRANQLAQLIVHGNEHYGNLVTYMRIKGIVPPSSAQ